MILTTTTKFLQQREQVRPDVVSGRSLQRLVERAQLPELCPDQDQGDLPPRQEGRRLRQAVCLHPRH